MNNHVHSANSHEQFQQHGSCESDTHRLRDESPGDDRCELISPSLSPQRTASQPRDSQPRDSQPRDSQPRDSQARESQPLPSVAQSPPLDSSDLVPAIERELQSLVGERRYANWFDKATRFEVASDELVVFCGSPYLQTWLQQQFRDTLLSAGRVVLGGGIRLRLEVDPTLAAPSSESTPKSGSRTTGPLKRIERSSHSNGNGFGRRRFASLSDFIAGPKNELALTAAQQTAAQPGQALNPLFLYGPVGIGKTHLLEGVYREIRRQYPSLHVLYLTADNFANYFTQALREKSLPSFHQRFRTVDVLIVDDVDFLDGKRGFQEEFLHTLKSLESSGRQIVMSCDRHPRLLTKTSDELISRFLAGMSCRLEAPDEPTRLEIVKRFVNRHPFPIADDALKFVAQRFAGNVRELAGAVNCLQTYHTMTNRRVTVRDARDVLARLQRDCMKFVRLADIEMAVCELFQLSTDEIRSSKRSRSISAPRMLAMYLSRRLTGSAYSEIGDHYGGRNHSTVMAAEKKVRRLLEEQASIRVTSQDWTIAELVESLEAQLTASV